MGVVFIDLDRTLLRRASGPALNAALVEEGVLPANRSIPGDQLLYALYDHLGENVVSMALARAAARVAKGWSQASVQRAAGRAVPHLMELVQPYAPGVLASYRKAGESLVLATTTPVDMVTPFAEVLGFDGVIATRYQVREGRYTGRLDGGFVWGLGKLLAARRWAKSEGVELSSCTVCTDSVFDLPLLSAVGAPRAVNPDPRLLAVATLRRWPIEHWDRPPGVPSLAGLEPYEIFRPLLRPEAFPYARFDIKGVDRIPRRGPVILAANHRSYFDTVTLALVAAKLGRPVRFLAKRELFELPFASWVARAIGGIPVDRGSRSDEPLREAEAALRAGEVVLILPQGTIPRGPAFFDPVLKAKTGTARLAARTGAPVVPVGVWGTEKVWPRSSRVPDVVNVLHPPRVRVRVGRPIELGLIDAVSDTERLMAAIVELLPPQARKVHEATPEELARTYPPGKGARTTTLDDQRR